VRLPYEDEALDGIIGVGALSRLLHSTAMLAEVRRVLKPGARAVLSEQRDARSGDWVARWQTRIDLAHEAHRVGLRAMEGRELAEPVPGYTEAATAAADAFMVFVRNGARALTSRRPGVLRGRIRVDPLPSFVTPNRILVLKATIENTGDTVWLREPSRFGGFVTLACRLLTTEGVPVSGTLRRTRLAVDVPPGESTKATVRFRVPPTLAPGKYTLALDLYNELVCSFSELDSEGCSRLPVVVRLG
jgi:hypothetical protein